MLGIDSPLFLSGADLKQSIITSSPPRPRLRQHERQKTPSKAEIQKICLYLASKRDIMRLRPKEATHDSAKPNEEHSTLIHRSSHAHHPYTYVLCVFAMQQTKQFFSFPSSAALPDRKVDHQSPAIVVTSQSHHPANKEARLRLFERRKRRIYLPRIIQRFQERWKGVNVNLAMLEGTSLALQSAPLKNTPAKRPDYLSSQFGRGSVVVYYYDGK